jgi:hypothetical protein
MMGGKGQCAACVCNKISTTGPYATTFSTRLPSHKLADSDRSNRCDDAGLAGKALDGSMSGASSMPTEIGPFRDQRNCQLYSEVERSRSGTLLKGQASACRGRLGLEGCAKRCRAM